MQLKHDLRAIAAHFQIGGKFKGSAPHGSGHINDTYAVTFSQNGGPARYILQRVNHNIFKNPAALMENIERVASHVWRKLEARGAGQINRRVLTLVPARDGRSWHADTDGNCWRCYLFVERAATCDRIETPAQAREGAKAFGLFQRQLADLPSPRLHETTPNFHYSRQWFNALRAAVGADPHNRAATVKREIEFCLRREPMVDMLLDLQARGLLPERVTYNDTKLNNVMLDDATGEGVCVIELDTVMPGLALYAFGDMCRTGCSPTAEDELSKLLTQKLLHGQTRLPKLHFPPVAVGAIAGSRSEVQKS